MSEVHARHKAEDAEALSRMHREQLETRNKLQMLGTHEPPHVPCICVVARPSIFQRGRLA